jgi:hypothetical protein
MAVSGVRSPCEPPCEPGTRLGEPADGQILWHAAAYCSSVTGSSQVVPSRSSTPSSRAMAHHVGVGAAMPVLFTGWCARGVAGTHRDDDAVAVDDMAPTPGWRGGSGPEAEQVSRKASKSCIKPGLMTEMGWAGRGRCEAGRASCEGVGEPRRCGGYSQLVHHARARPAFDLQT